MQRPFVQENSLSEHCRGAEDRKKGALEEREGPRRGRTKEQREVTRKGKDRNRADWKKKGADSSSQGDDLNGHIDADAIKKVEEKSLRNLEKKKEKEGKKRKKACRTDKKPG